MLRLTFSPVTSFYSDVEPFSKYSPVTLHLSHNTRILNENLEYAVFCSKVSFNLLLWRMQDAELVKASGYRSRSESAGFSGFSPEDDLVYKNKVIVYRINFTSLFIEHACINRVRIGHSKPGKSWNLRISFSRPGRSWNVIASPWK